MALTPNVVPDELIESAWGNQIRDRTWQVFATKAELDALWPAATAPSGAHAWTTTERLEWVRYGALWQPSPAAQGTLDEGSKVTASGPSSFSTITNLDPTLLRVDFTLYAQRRVKVTGFSRSIISTVNADRFEFIIRRLVPSDAVVSALVSPRLNANEGVGMGVVLYEALLPAGTYAYVLAGLRVGASTGNFTVDGAATSPCFIVAEDLGAL
jgi:hypothetical protein